MKQTLAGGLAALVLLVVAGPALDVQAQDRGHDRRDGGHDRGRGEAGLIGGLALGAALGVYAGHPYYCRQHHHWRWSRRRHRYVSVTSRGHDC